MLYIVNDAALLVGPSRDRSPVVSLGIFSVDPSDGEVRVASRGQEIVSVASQGDRFKFISCVPGLQPQAYELRSAVSKDLHQVHRKIGVYKMSNNWNVLTQFYCTLLYTQLCAHLQNC